MPREVKTIRIDVENDVFQIFDAMKRKRETRNKENAFLFEGVRNINNALQYGWRIKAFIYTTERKLSGWATEVLASSRAETLYELPLRLLQKLSDKEEASEILAVAEMPRDDMRRIKFAENPLIVLFDRPSSPGNLGTLIRSCDAFGAQGLIITGHAVDVYEPETVSATTGSLFALPIVRVASHKELLPWFENMRKIRRGLQIVGADEKGETSLDKHDFTTPTILLVGNETRGLSEAYREMADALVQIPMHGSASSLNVACASSIMLYEANRQRGFAANKPGT